MIEIQQNTVDEGVEQLNLAFDEYGVNFLDTAEMYPGNFQTCIFSWSNIQTWISHF